MLVRQSDGRYQPYDDRGQELQAATDFFSSVLYALPDSERQALDIDIGQSETLKNAIRARPVPRDELRLAITPPPVIEPAADTLRLLGADGYRPLPRRNRSRTFTLENRARALYPRLSQQELQAFISWLRDRPAGAHAELSRLSLEYNQLTLDLARWANNTPVNDPATGTMLTPIQRRASLQNRGLLRTAIERCWRRETRVPLGDVLYVAEPILGELPVLNADFSHVSGLTVVGSASTQGLEPFRQLFPNLVYLDVRNFTLPELPQSLADMPRLRQLIVRNCAITLTPADRQLLASLTELTLLDLQGNLLSGAPDIGALPSLGHLNLADTGISSVPADLLDRPQTIIARFDGNLIGELPEAFFELSAELSEGFDFSNNPLSLATRERIKAHYIRTSQHFGVLADPADILRTVALFPELGPYQASDLLYRLPGTLAEGRAQLTNWEAELTQLNNDLVQWIDRGPDRHAVSGEQLTAIERQQERLARENFRQALEQAWRSRIKPDLVLTAEFSEDMPAISADFNHVTRLTISGNRTLRAPNAFLQRFPNLERLEMIEFTLGTIPQSVTGMPELRTLILEDCGVVLNPESQSLLDTLSHLHTLELNDNPLGVPPDITALTQLTHLDVSRTGISTVPAGLADHPSLDSAYLTGNQFRDLPEALFNLTAHRSDGIDFEDNPLSPATRDRIKNYFQTVRQDFGVSAELADVERVRAMFPALDHQDASDVIYDLPGTLAQGRVRLHQWHAEFSQLKLDLSIWQQNKPAQADAEAMAAFSQTLVKFWRRRPEIARLRDDHFLANLSFAADMPQLSTDFSHVTRLTLSGNVAIEGVDAFIELFPNLYNLDLRNFNLQQIPQAVTRMPALKQMTLSNCNVTLTPSGQAALSALGELQVLDLSHNALVTAPDVENMPGLVDLWLSNTGITHLPNGLISRTRLKVAMLSDNQITELPAAFFTLRQELAAGINLANNPLSVTSRDLIKTYFAAFTDDFGIWAEQADIDRARALFPGMNPEEASRMIYKLPGTLEDGRAQLGQWEVEIAQLTHDLRTWADDIPTHSATGAAMSDAEKIAERNGRYHFRKELEQFWRQRLVETSEKRADAFGSNLGFTGEIPPLSADFSHVRTLALNGNPASNVCAGFLECFTGVQHLALRGFGLGRVPQAISGMQSLQSLTLSNCAIVLDAPGQAVLSSLAKLTSLDLFFNPLGQAPNLATLPTLSYIDLSSTGIEQIPVGLADHPALTVALLTDNRIAEIPRELYSASSDKDLFLGGNPLSAVTREQLKAYYQQTGKDMGVPADQADRDLLQSLYPTMDATAASDFIYRIPGTLNDGRMELLRREAELSTLISDLTVWMTDIPEHPVTGLPLDAQSLLEEQRKRRAFKESLENCWRRIPTETLTGDPYAFYSSSAIFGELPTLTADFSHVPEMYLTSAVEARTRVGNFLDYFPNLQSLAVRGYQLNNIPDAIFRMEQLTSLSLPHGNITLTHSTLNALAGMEQLDYLNLRNNPLGLTPDLSNMNGMSILNLSETGITHIPDGLWRIETWLNVDLSNNAITVMPPELLEVPPDVGENLDFSGNPFNEESLRIIANYYRETDNDLGINEVADISDDEDNMPPIESIED
ncbi:leucine-rich repeat domain-containing protein [Pseudomonas fluorescens]|uniref:leucine-rich repeat domain-containing protein n=1 Tax=Pseudomonas fluorescens TaxID=294 RepID=UPI00178397A9|nr:hypothetical protein [Pseudomonas fluorescens]